jgi:tRNA pseudouridine38-40 synthase
MRHFLLTVAYDGADFRGWQRQREGATVQGVLEQTIARIVGGPARVRGAGRTDAGVHALGQRAAFSAPTRLGATELRRALNATLPDSVRVTAAEETDAPVDPRRAAWRKTYVYQFHVGDLLPPERRRHFAWAGRSLDVAAMRRAARELAGVHDFTSFARREATRRGAVRRIDAVRVRSIPRGVRVFVTGSGFLYNMVRTLASALLEVGRGRREPGAIAAMLAARDRASAPATLPAHGLWLWRVDLGAARAAAPLSAAAGRSETGSGALVRALPG